MGFETCRNPADQTRPPRPVLKKVPVTDGPFAETKELVGGSKGRDAT